MSTQSGTEYTENFGSFTGSDTIWSRTAREGETLKISGTAEIKSGSWKLVLVDPDDNVTVLLEYGGSLAASYRELLRINVVNRNSPPDKNAGEDQYKLLGSRGYYDYKVYYPAVLEDESFRVTESDIGRCFSLLP